MTATGSLRVKQRAFALAQPLSALLELTYHCNWRCVFCYNPRHSDLRGLSGAEWIAVLDDLRSLGTLTVTLTGGEPLAHPEFLAIARAARERALALNVFTNGSLVNDALADALAALTPVAVEMSVHGACAATHDRTTGRPGSFASMLGGIERLQARGVRLLLKTPLTRWNETEIDGIVALAESRGVPLRLDPTLTPRDDGDRGPLAYAATAAGVERLYRQVAALGQLPTAVRTPGGANCGVGRVTLAVDPEGNVYPCLQWRVRSLGNVRETPLAEMWRTSPVREEAAAFAQTANDRLLAGGGALARFPFCPALAQQATGDPLGIDPAHRLRAEAAERIRSSIA
jgi:MoaA/NifB/PqqE/SkfB family radical SAM enzyme